MCKRYKILRTLFINEILVQKNPFNLRFCFLLFFFLGLFYSFFFLAVGLDMYMYIIKMFLKVKRIKYIKGKAKYTRKKKKKKRIQRC